MLDILELTQQDIEMEKYLLECYRKSLSKMPKGRMVCREKGNAIRYYLVEDRFVEGKKKYHQKYLSSKDKDLIEGLKKRKIAEQAIKTIEQNIKIQNSVLKKYRPYDTQSLCSSMAKAYQKLEGNCFINKKMGQREMGLYKGPFHGTFNEMTSVKYGGYSSWDEWARADYQTHPFNDNKIHPTSSGKMVRSKGEVIIAESSSSMKVPFRYEQLFQLIDTDGNYHNFYPDFLFPNRIYQWTIWEHCGKFNDEKYFADFCRKLEIYHWNGFSLGKNLIVTTDDCIGSIDARNIKQTLEVFIAAYI